MNKTIIDPTTTADTSHEARRALIAELVAAEAGAETPKEPTATRVERLFEQYAEYPDRQIRIWINQAHERAARAASYRRARTLLAPYAGTIDENWYVLIVQREPEGRLTVRLNGPAHGDADLPAEAVSLLQAEVPEWLPQWGEGFGRKTIGNPRHVFAFRPDVVLLEFEDTDNGYVTGVENGMVRYRRIDADEELTGRETTFVECLTVNDEGDVSVDSDVLGLAYCPCRMVGCAWGDSVLRNGKELEIAIAACRSAPSFEGRADHIAAALEKHRSET